METCGNCGRRIGSLETPCLWRDEIVCAGCRRILDRAQRQGLAHRHMGPIIACTCCLFVAVVVGVISIAGSPKRVGGSFQQPEPPKVAAQQPVQPPADNVPTPTSPSLTVSDTATGPAHELLVKNLMAHIADAAARPPIFLSGGTHHDEFDLGVERARSVFPSFKSALELASVSDASSPGSGDGFLEFSESLLNQEDQARGDVRRGDGEDFRSRLAMLWAIEILVKNCDMQLSQPGMITDEQMQLLDETFRREKNDFAALCHSHFEALLRIGTDDMLSGK